MKPIERGDYCACQGETRRELQGKLSLLRCKDCGRLAGKEQGPRVAHDVR